MILIPLWLLAWALAFSSGIDFCTVEWRKHIDLGLGSGSHGWVQVRMGSGKDQD